jgi:hypothetical protein
MNRFLFFLSFTFLLNSCNDGNLQVENFNFDSSGEAAKCSLSNSIVYKLKGNEAFIINFPETTFPTDATPVNVPKVVSLETNKTVSYTFFNGKVTPANICDIERPISPAATGRWTANTGDMVITTTAIIDDSDKTNNSTRITGYNHYIEFKNITFIKTDGVPETFQTKAFGNYVAKITPLVVKSGNDLLKKCATTTPNLIYGIDGNNTLTLEIDPNLLATATDNTPSTGLIGDKKNILKYTLFKNDGTIRDDYFCNTTIPTLPTISQTWLGENGIEGVSGMVSVAKKTFATTIEYTITLNKVSLRLGNSSFKIGDTFVYGTYKVSK